MTRNQTMAVAIPAIVVASVALAYRTYESAYPTYTYRYRLTVEVEVNGQKKLGSSVIEVTGTNEPLLSGGTQLISRVRGDSVFVELGERRNVVALLAAPGDEAASYAARIVPHVFQTDLEKLPTLPGDRTLDASDFPMFVTFKNLSDPKSVEIVDPTNFEATFGLGVRLKDVTIEMTDDPVTTGIEERLPLIEQLREEAKASHVTSIGDPFYLGLGDLEQGL